MHKLAFGVLLLIMSACSMQQPNFERMSEQELFEYNSTVSLSDQVYCRDDVRTGSHIPDRLCSTYGKTLQGHVQRLPTPSSNKSFTYVK